MKGTEHFKETIKRYLDGRAQTDELFAVSYAKENKNLDDCTKTRFAERRKRRAIFRSSPRRTDCRYKEFSG
ncbi:hypothetical protein E1J02_05120 [Phocaeicola dorei]|nr:hypothetical protein E1J05_00130 [Phocaeicola dorei]TDA91414.1 hypothetical protein E1J02_05120 [Phocaeicola dorei]